MIDLNAITQAVGDLNEVELVRMLNDFVASGPTEDQAKEVVTACQQGMAKVGDLFESGEYYVGDLIFAGELLTTALDIFKSVMGKSNTAKCGKIVLGTIEGDLHDIGKNIFKSMAEAAGFEVFDLGFNQEPEEFVRKVQEVQPQIVGMSGVLTLALESMKRTVEALKAAGMRDSVKVIIGGNPVNKIACKQIGADAFTINAAEGVKICQSWVTSVV